MECQDLVAKDENMSISSAGYVSRCTTQYFVSTRTGAHLKALTACAQDCGKCVQAEVAIKQKVKAAMFMGCVHTVALWLH